MRGRLSRSIVADAALEAARTNGIERVTLRHVAASLGVVPTALYGHVADRDDLYRAIAQAAYGRLAAAMSQAATGEDDPVERVRKIVRAYCVFGSEDRVRFRIMTRFRPQLTPTWTDDQLPAGNAAYEVVASAVSDAIQSGRFINVDAGLAALAMLATARGTTTFALVDDEDRGDDPEVAFAVLDTVIDAFAQREFS